MCFECVKTCLLVYKVCFCINLQIDIYTSNYENEATY